MKTQFKCRHTYRNGLSTTVILLLFFIAVLPATAQPSQEGKLQAAILYNIVKYFEWPNKTDSGDIEIAVLGNDDVYDALKANYDGKPVGTKKCIIRKVSSSSDISPNSVIYLGKSRSNEFNLVKNMAASKSLLTITEKEDMGARGSCVNFIVVDGRLRFELNRAAISTSNLKVSGALTSMAIMI